MFALKKEPLQLCNCYLRDMHLMTSLISLWNICHQSCLGPYDKCLGLQAWPEAIHSSSSLILTSPWESLMKGTFQRNNTSEIWEIYITERGGRK